MIKQRTPGRPRSSKNLPPGINPDKLPANVWYKATGSGHWMYNYFDETGKRKNTRLCGKTATLAEIYQAVEAQQTRKSQTFTTLSAEFEQTHIWRKLSPLTQKDYSFCRAHIISRPTSTGNMGDIPVSRWTVGLIRQYRDKRGEESESRANKELAYIKRLFAWAYEYEKIPSNPATGIKKLTIPPRQHYAEDKDYHYLLNVAKQSGYWYLPYAMELAYLCCMRLSEVLDLTDANELENGLLIRRRKGSKNTIVTWEPRLKQNWDAIKQKRNEILTKRKQPHPIKPDQRHLFISERTGDKITEGALKNAKDRVSKEAIEQAKTDKVNYIPFTFHDVKRKGVSDTEGDKMKASGHRSPGMMTIYDVKTEVVKPTKLE